MTDIASPREACTSNKEGWKGVIMAFSKVHIFLQPWKKILFQIQFSDKLFTMSDLGQILAVTDFISTINVKKHRWGISQLEMIIGGSVYWTNP